MLLVAKRRRMALHVAVLPLLGSLAVGIPAGRALAASPSRGAVVAALLAGGMLVYVVSSFKLVRARAHTLVLRSLFGREVFDARASAFGVTASYNGRSGATYTVYVTDGPRRSDIATYTSRRALGAADRLTATFTVANRGGSAEARGVVAREIAAWKAQEDETMRQVNAYYASPAWRRLPIFIGVGVALYLAVMGVVMYLDR